MKVIQVSLRHGTQENGDVTTLVTYIEKARNLKEGCRITLKDHDHPTWWWHVEKIYDNSEKDSSQLHKDWKVGGLV
jgi:hypothetical protein